MIQSFEVAKSFYKKRLNVNTLSNPISMSDFNSNCGSFYNVATSVTISNSDLHIYVDANNDSAASGAVASGIPCVFIGGNLPDVTNSVGRPIAGLIKMNVYDFTSVISYPTSLYASTIATIIH